MKISLKSLQLIKQTIALMFFLSSFAVVESQRFLVVVVFFRVTIFLRQERKVTFAQGTCKPEENLTLSEGTR